MDESLVINTSNYKPPKGKNEIKRNQYFTNVPDSLQLTVIRVNEKFL